MQLYALIRITNGTTGDLYDCRVNLASVKEKVSGKWEERKHKIVRTTDKLLWPGLGRSDKIIRRGDNERVDIAINRHGVTNFCFIDNAFHKLGDGKTRTLYVKLIFSGKLVDKFIEDVVFEGFLKYEESKTIRRLYLEPGGLPADVKK